MLGFGFTAPRVPNYCGRCEQRREIDGLQGHERDP